MSGLPVRISIKAPAKINLSLHVLNRLPDGYHNIVSWMHAVGLYDRVYLRRVSRMPRSVLRVTGAALPSGRNNLVMRAVHAFFERFDVRGGVEIRLVKRIPVSAGLGGGSSDAGATLRGLVRLFGIRTSSKDLRQLGRSVGSDVPFFLSGASALVEGTGDRITVVRPIGGGWAVLVNPVLPVSTEWAYRQLDRIRAGRGPGGREKIGLTLAKRQNKIKRQSGLAFQLKKLSPYLHNDLEEATIQAHPVIGVVKERLLGLGARGVLMSGSGPTVFGLFHQSTSALRAAGVLMEQHREWRVWVARLLGRRSSIIRRSSNG